MQKQLSMHLFYIKFCITNYCISVHQLNFRKNRFIYPCSSVLASELKRICDPQSDATEPRNERSQGTRIKTGRREQSPKTRARLTSVDINIVKLNYNLLYLTTNQIFIFLFLIFIPYFRGTNEINQ